MMTIRHKENDLLRGLMAKAARGLFLSLALTVLLIYGNTVAHASQPWRVMVDFDQRLSPVPEYFASANINSVRRMLEQPAGFDEAVRGLGIRFMRFQIGGKLDYREWEKWDNEYFETLHDAVERAYAEWGATDLMFCISGMTGPFDENGKFIEEDMDVYAEACAELVRRFAPPGTEKVRFWEPFNEWNLNTLNRMKEHGQSFDLVAEQFRRCAERMREVNPSIMVGGPALTHAHADALRRFLQYAGDSVDFISWHDYAVSDAAIDDDRVLQIVTESNRFANGVRRVAEVVEQAGLEGVLLFIDEFQVNSHSWSPSDPRTVNHFAAVFVASVFANLASSKIDALFIHDIFGRHYGLLAPSDYDLQNAKAGALWDVSRADAIYIRPAGWVYHWFTHLVGGDWVSCRVELPEGAAASKRGALLEAVAWRDGDRCGVMLVNKDTQPRAVEIVWGRKVVTESYVLPLSYYGIDANGAAQGERSGTRNGKLIQLLPGMSVTFLVTQE